MRKTVGIPKVQANDPRMVNVQEEAHVAVTSEDPEHPIEHAFDGRGVPEGTEWIASAPGDQSITVTFDAPQAIRAIVMEVHEAYESRTQEVELSVATGTGPLVPVLRQEFVFSPSGATVERERWAVDRKDVRQVRLAIKPDKGGAPRRARLTTLAFERAG